MIGKKVKNPKKSSSKSVRIRRLTSYVLEPAREDRQEKCVYHGSRNFITDEVVSQKAEMAALAQDAVRSKDPINHYVLSWPAGEKPTPAQVDNAVDLLLEDFGTQDHQAIYGLHVDTDNYHLHIVLNRVHPETLKCVEINRGFDIEALHRTVAKIEQAQGWKPENNAVFRVGADGELEKRQVDDKRPRRPDQMKIDKELRTGEKSAERTAIEEAGPLIKEAGTWEQLHRDLAERGMRYVKMGSGAVVYVGEVAVKASSVAREAGFGRLQKRLGPYQAAPVRGEVEEPKEQKPSERAKERSIRSGEPTLLKTAAAAIEQAQTWEELHRSLAKCGLRYVRTGSGAVVQMGDVETKASSVAREAGLGQLQKRLGPYQGPSLKYEVDSRSPEPISKTQSGWEDYLEEKRNYYYKKQQEKIEIDQQQNYKTNELQNKYREQRLNILNGNWQGLGIARNALRSKIAADQAAEKAKIKDEYKLKLEQWRQKYKQYPSYEEWRFRDNEEGQEIVGNTYSIPQIQDIRFFFGEIVGGKVLYTKKDDKNNISFIDYGNKITINDWKNPETILAALQLASEKWNAIKVTGCKEFIDLSVKVALENGITLTNPEFQERIQKTDARQDQDQDQEPKPTPKLELEPEPEPEPEEEIKIKRPSPGMGR
jgi:hypothetical protein